MIKFKIIAIILLFGAFAFSCNGQEAKASKDLAKESVVPTDRRQLMLILGDKVLYAKFKDSPTTQDFIKQLPLNLKMGDLRGREKYSPLAAELSKEGVVSTTFEEGDISYWLGGGLAVFYHQNNSEVKAGLIVLARLENGMEAFSGPDPLDVKFEAVKINEQ